MSNKSSDQLFVLIKSLSKPEKRYFRLYSNRHTPPNKKNTYLVLFNAMDKEDDYDEERIKRESGIKGANHRFSIAKNRLYNHLLRSLDAFYYNSSIDADLRRQLHAVEILYKKSLYDQSFKILKGAKKLAYKHEKHTILIEILNWEKLLIEKDNYEGVSSEDIDNVLAEDRRIAGLIEAYNEFWSVKSHLFNLLFRRGKARSEEDIVAFKKLIDHTLLNRSEDEMSLSTRYLYYHIYSAYYFGIGDYAKCFGFLEKNIAFIETNYEHFQEEPNVYVSVLTNAIYVGMQLKKFDASFNYLEKLRNVPEKLVINSNENLDIRLFSSANSIKLTLHAITGDFENGLSIVPEVEAGIEKYRDKLSSVRKASFFFSIAILYFGAGRFSDALKWINELLNHINMDESEDIYCFTQILNLVVHLELGNNELVPYTLRSTSRYLETRNRVYKFESAMLRFMAKISKAADPYDLSEIYSSLAKELEQLETDPLESAAFEHFDFTSWARSKATGRPFKELVKEKAGLPVHA